MLLGDKVNEFQNQVAGFANCCTLFNAGVKYVENEPSARILTFLRSPRIDQGTNSARTVAQLAVLSTFLPVEKSANPNLESNKTHLIKFAFFVVILPLAPDC
jgi:hypothetical protein